jgi:uncharacterized protein YuzE
LYDKKEAEVLNDFDVKQSSIKNLINNFIEEILEKSNLNKFSLRGITNITPTNDDKFILNYESATKKTTIDNKNVIYNILDDVDLNGKVMGFIKEKKVANIHFYLQGTNEYFYDFISKKDKLSPNDIKNIAGKAIYGVDFNINNKKFGRENVNILMQTSKPLIITLHKNNDDIDGILLDVDDKGHIMYNPNLPSDVSDKMDSIIKKFEPILNVRYTRKEVFRWQDKNGEQNIFLGARFLILPRGKKAISAIEIK